MIKINFCYKDDNKFLKKVHKRFSQYLHKLCKLRIRSNLAEERLKLCYLVLPVVAEEALHDGQHVVRRPRHDEDDEDCRQCLGRFPLLNFMNFFFKVLTTVKFKILREREINESDF